MTNTAHHDFTPSNLRRRELCPGSRRLEKDLPELFAGGNSDPDARRLKKLILAELVLIYGFEADHLELTADYESAEDSETIKKMIRKLYEIIGGRTILGGNLETPLAFHYLGRELYRSRPDLLLLGTDRVIVINWQLGYQAYPGKASTVQGAAYALAAMQAFGRNTAEVHYYNPLLEQYETCVYEDQYAVIAHVAGIIAKCGETAAPLIPGREQCRYCKAADHGCCPAFIKSAELTAAEAEELAPRPSLAQLPAAELCRLYHACKMAEKLLGRVESRIRTVCEESGQCGNLMLKQISGGREIKDIDAAYDKVNGLFNPGEFLQFCTLSAAQLEKGYARKLKTAAKVKTEKEGKAVFNEIMQGLIAEKPSKKMLVEAV